MNQAPPRAAEYSRLSRAIKPPAHFAPFHGAWLCTACWFTGGQALYRPPNIGNGRFLIVQKSGPDPRNLDPRDLVGGGYFLDDHGECLFDCQKHPIVLEVSLSNQLGDHVRCAWFPA